MCLVVSCYTCAYASFCTYPGCLVQCLTLVVSHCSYAWWYHSVAASGLVDGRESGDSSEDDDVWGAIPIRDEAADTAGSNAEGAKKKTQRRAMSLGIRALPSGTPRKRTADEGRFGGLSGLGGSRRCKGWRPFHMPVVAPILICGGPMIEEEHATTGDAAADVRLCPWMHSGCVP